MVLRTFDEVEDADAWSAADVPGSPFAVALDADGTVLAKGTFNTARSSSPSWPRPSAAARSCGRELEGARIADAVAEASSRRGFLARVGAAVMGVAGARTVGSLVAPGEAEAYHFCGHIYTTDSCPHPTGLPRIDATGLPLKAKDGRPVDDLGRYVNELGQPVDEDGNVLVDADGTPLPNATRTPRLRRHRGRVRLQAPHRRRLVPLLRRPRAQARRLLRLRHASASTATRR